MPGTHNKQYFRCHSWTRMLWICPIQRGQTTRKARVQHCRQITARELQYCRRYAVRLGAIQHDIPGALFDAPGEYYWVGVAPFEYELRQHLDPLHARLNTLSVPLLVSSGTPPDCSPQVKASKSKPSGVPHKGTIKFQSTCVMTTLACTVTMLCQ